MCFCVWKRKDGTIFLFLWAPPTSDVSPQRKCSSGGSIYTACSTQLCVSLLGDREQVARLTRSGAAIQGSAESFPLLLSGPWVCKQEGSVSATAFPKGRQETGQPARGLWLWSVAAPKLSRRGHLAFSAPPRSIFVPWLSQSLPSLELVRWQLLQCSLDSTAPDLSSLEIRWQLILLSVFCENMANFLFWGLILQLWLPSWLHGYLYIDLLNMIDIDLCNIIH